MKDTDHQKIARQFITMYDEAAENEASGMASKMLCQGNIDGFNMWTQIAVVIANLTHRVLPETTIRADSA